MSLSRQRLFTLAIAALAVVGVALTVSAQDPATAEVIKKLEALEKRIASLESTLSQRMASLEQKVGAGAAPVAAAAPPSPLEAEAQTAFAEINQLVAAGKQGEAKAKMGDFMKKYASTNAARSASRLNAELDVVGKAAPANWGIEKWFQGESEIDLASSKTTLVVFWEEWCPHCKREVPKMQELYTSLHPAGLQLIGVTKITKTSTEDGVRKFVSDQGVKYPLAKEDGTLSAHFAVGGIPAAAVLKDGKVIWRGHPARLSESMIKAWL